ncbi:MAG: hypothetical protein JW891_18430 [Candidatus Lokiarchaeota archaeon]|nr:hypothetical protein [Candidatus Lokiarchaeota archaeon]
MFITINFLKQIARSIYDKIHPILGTKEASIEMQRGAGGDISMKVDLIAENTVIDYLEKNNANILLISEEVGEKYIGNKNEIINNHFKLIVDPIDGSYNASRGIPFCCASLAFAVGDTLDDIQKSVIIDLSSGDIFWAEKEKGAFLNDQHISVSERGIGDKCVYELDFGLNALDGEIKTYGNILKYATHVRVMGSCALSLCQLAKGSIDAFVNFKSSMRLVDAAAGILILKEAGGSVIDFKGKQLSGKLSINQRFSFIASNKALESFFIRELKNLDLD